MILVLTIPVLLIILISNGWRDDISGSVGAAPHSEYLPRDARWRVDRGTRRHDTYRAAACCVAQPRCLAAHQP